MRRVNAVPFWKNRSIWAWAMYDFANSAFATTVLAVVFNVYFVTRVVPPEGLFVFGLQIPGESLWAYTVSLSMFLIFAMAPVLGAMADYYGKKKVFLTIFWLIGCAATAGLFVVKPGDVWKGIFLFVMGNVGFAGGNVFYNGFLPHLGEREVMGRVSGFGWAVGYAGGGLCLALNLVMINFPGAFGLTAGDEAVRACFLVVGLWWFLFGLPQLFWLKEEGASKIGEAKWKALSIGCMRLWDTVRHFRRFSNLGKFLLAYLVYNDGIETIILMASIFGAQALGMAQNDLILCFLMIQGVAFLGSLLFGWSADRFRHKPTLFITLGIYVAVIIWAYVMQTRREFWVLGAIVGLILGGSQAASRSLMGILTPPQKSAEFFAFFSVVGKMTAVLGPLQFGLVTQFWGIRAGILSLLIYFVFGGALLMFVKEPDTLSAPG